jgi:hypothetical protein
MPSFENLAVIYQDLADVHERQGQPQMRDRFLVLAADAAQCAGRDDEAERLRQRLLKRSPHHMLRPFASFAEALASPDVQKYVSDLRRSYPPAEAERLLETARSRASPERGPEGRPIPPTAPVVDLAESSPRAGAGHEPLKVYRVQDEGGSPAGRRPTQAQPAPRPTTAGAPRSAAPPARPAPSAAPRFPPERRSQPEPPRRAPGIPPDDEEETAPGAWLSAVLFVVVLAGGLALAAYTFAGPFLPPGWGR